MELRFLKLSSVQGAEIFSSLIYIQNQCCEKIVTTSFMRCNIKKSGEQKPIPQVSVVKNFRFQLRNKRSGKASVRRNEKVVSLGTNRRFDALICENGVSEQRASSTSGKHYQHILSRNVISLSNLVPL